MSKVADRGIHDPTSDIHVHFLRKGLTHILGTWQQLQDEGFIPHTAARPERIEASWRLNDCATLSVQRKWVPGARSKGKLGVRLLDSDWWCIRIEHDHFPYENNELRTYLEERRRQNHLRTREGQIERLQMINRVVKARSDEAFQEFRRTLLPQRGRGVHHG